MAATCCAWLVGCAGVAGQAALRVERTGTGVAAWRGDRLLWNLEIDTPEGRPFFHPLSLPSGRILTDLRPPDHVWHLGYWFSWKYVNGVNYWEPADPGRRGREPEGRTRVTRRDVDVDGPACRVRLRLEYGPRGSGDAVLSEARDVEIVPHGADGGYSITARHRFTALADVTLGRTPPHGSVASGRWGGGYAGATLRLAPDVAASFSVRGSSGGATPAECTARETGWLDFSDPETGEGVEFAQLEAPASARFYLWPDSRMVNPSPVYAEPLSLRKGETLDLAYRLRVRAGGAR